MKAFLNRKHVILVWLCAGLLYGSIGQRQVRAQCVCRGDMADVYGMPIPDGIVDLGDLNYFVWRLFQFGPPYVGPATGLPCADVADPNAIGPGGDGQLDLGDLNFFVWDLVSYQWYVIPCPPGLATTLPGSTDSEIQIQVNGTPWDGFSQVEVNDVIQVAWVENDSNWVSGFSNFNLNVSHGEYLNDFNSPITWDIINLTVGPDGQGGINVGGGCASMWGTTPLVFTFSFRIPVEVGPAYTIHIRPTQGSWCRVPFDQLPTVDLEVMQEAECVNPPAYDLNDDCKVDLIDFALLVSEWLSCGLDVQEACWD